MKFEGTQAYVATDDLNGQGGGEIIGCPTITRRPVDCERRRLIQSLNGASHVDSVSAHGQYSGIADLAIASWV